MSKYIVRDVVCDWGICSVDDLGKEELVEVCNSKANAELICDILNTDLMKDGKYTIWKDKKISDLETKLAESESKSKESEIFYKREINRRDTKLRNIKQQLAEKDEEINVYKKYIKVEDQEKISFAVEQLEKVKAELEFTSNNNEWITARDDKILNGICDFIDNQINQLKEYN